MSGISHISSRPEEMVAARLTALVAKHVVRTIALSGGSTPRALFRVLADKYADAAPWDSVTLFQVDERCVPPDHADSNYRMIREELLIPLPQLRLHRIPAETAEAASVYEEVLRKHVSPNEVGVPQLDLVLLGMGADGHTASLFPDTAGLNEQEHWVMRNTVPQLDTERVTLTYPVLAAAALRWFLVKGADKAPAYAQVRQGWLPAGKLADCEWFVSPDVVG